MILHLDQRREVIIDSKVSMKAYVDYVNAENEVDRRRFLKEHIDSSTACPLVPLVPISRDIP